MDSKNKLNCPVDKNAELLRTELEPNLSSFSCYECEGHWIRGKEYWAWVEEHATDRAERLHEEETLSLAEPGVPVDCPECRFRMVKYLVGRGLDFSRRSLRRLQRNLAGPERMGGAEEAQSSRRSARHLHSVLASGRATRTAKEASAANLSRPVRRRGLRGNQSHPALAGNENKSRRVDCVSDRQGSVRSVTLVIGTQAAGLLKRTPEAAYRQGEHDETNNSLLG